jgi:hypothetical protein
MVKVNTAQELNTFFIWLKNTSEKQWQTTELNRTIFGFQIQKGTKWLKGLSDSDIAEYERIMGFGFPEVYKQFLKQMNGTDKQTINIYGESGEPYRYSVGFLSFPRDLELVKTKIAVVLEAFQITPRAVEQQTIPHIMPIIEHRFLVMDRCEGNLVLSIYEDDLILYASSLPQFLVKDIFQGWDPKKLFAGNKKLEHLAGAGSSHVTPKVKFWLEE